MTPKQKKFSQSLSDNAYEALAKKAEEHGAISVQELIRNVVIPEWLKRREGSRVS